MLRTRGWDVLCAAKLAVHVFICNVFARPETERMRLANAGCWIGRGCVGGLRICQLAEERARQETRRIASTADNLSWTGRGIGKEARAAREPGEIPLVWVLSLVALVQTHGGVRYSRRASAKAARAAGTAASLQLAPREAVS